MKKSKKYLIFLIIILALLIGVVLLIVLLPKDKPDEGVCKDGHSYSYTDLDENNHKKSCSNCSEVDETEAHVYDNDLDTTCDLCNHVRVADHTYAYTILDETNHKKSCSTCSEVDETEEHVYDDEQDTTCNLCGYERELGFTYKTPTGIKVAADKTELTAGDTFTLTVEIETTRKDLYWQAIDFIIGPMADEESVSVDTAAYFELVDYSFSSNFSNSRNWYDCSSDLFNSVNGTGGFRVSLAFTGTTLLSATEKFVLTAQIKIKETAAATEQFLFGITETNVSMVSFTTADYSTTVFDYADFSTRTSTGSNNEYENSETCGITTQKLTMCIKEN